MIQGYPSDALEMWDMTSGRDWLAVGLDWQEQHIISTFVPTVCNTKRKFATPSKYKAKKERATPHWVSLNSVKLTEREPQTQQVAGKDCEPSVEDTTENFGRTPRPQ
mmetsp:Transcript_7834/g.11305  ORF Transcript_7834/g.11305 Transcript_7834/m.11305 type:complete len:107 (-) Transcript_7834:416-736(-)